MTSALDYANWIVQNEGKKGTPEFETVAQAYKIAQESEKSVAGSDPLTLKGIGSTALEAGLRHGPIGAISAVASQGMDRAAHKGGEIVSQALAPYVPGEVAGGAGYLTNVGIQAVPTVLGGAIGNMAKPIMEKGGEALMRMALKPSSTLSPERSAQAVKTFLTGKVGNALPGAQVTQGGIDQIHRKISNLGDKVDDILDNSSALVSRAGIANATDKTRLKFGNQMTPESDLKAIQSVEDEFLRTYPSLIPIKQAHELKKGTYAVLGDKAYKGELKAAETEAQKALASGARMETEKGAPAIAPLNAEMSNLINAVKAAISRDAIAGNKDPMALSLLASNPLAAAAFMANRSEAVKSLLARIIYNSAGSVTTAAGAGAGAIIGEKLGRDD